MKNVTVFCPKSLPRGEGGPRRGSGEEFGRQTNDLKQPEDLHQGPITNLRISLNAFTNFQVTARIPHQSKIGSEEPIFASFPPGEAMGAAAPDTPGGVSLRSSLRVGATLAVVPSTTFPLPRHCEAVRPWQSPGRIPEIVRSTRRLHHRHSLRSPRAFGPRNDVVISTRSFFWWCGPDTPGEVSIW